MKSQTRENLENVFRAGLRAVDPERAVLAALRRDGGRLEVEDRVYDLDGFRRVVLVGGGKGTAPMARAVETVLGGVLEEGRIVVKTGHGLELRKTRITEASHPVPDAAGVGGTRQILELLRDCTADDLVIVALSGGGSALLPAPYTPLELEDKREATRLLLECGATIGEINTLRKHLSLIKGGRLAQIAHPATVVTLILSDVVGDPPDVIASGPTTADSTTFRDCLEIVERYRLAGRLPAGVEKVLREGAAGDIRETPAAGDPVLERVQNVIVGNNRAALQAACERARRLGYASLVLSSRIEGEAREAGRVLAAIARECEDSGSPLAPPAAILAGGETTVTLRGGGKGGRNQELALACALALEGCSGVAVLSAGTDGTDGPTDAAGAFADGDTCRRARVAGLDPRAFLARDDSYEFFRSLGDLFITGPTRTNVMDMMIFLVENSKEG
jgi:hydroxypyruvate reductase